MTSPLGLPRTSAQAEARHSLKHEGDGMEPLVIYEKAVRVVFSCRTPQHVETARWFLRLAQRRINSPSWQCTGLHTHLDLINSRAVVIAAGIDVQNDEAVDAFTGHRRLYGQKGESHD